MTNKPWSWKSSHSPGFPFKGFPCAFFSSSCWLIPAAGVSGHAQCLRSWNLGCPGLGREFLGVCNCPCSKARKYERLSFAISDFRNKKSRVSFLYPPKAFLENHVSNYVILLSGGKKAWHVCFLLQNLWCFSGAALLLAVATWQFTKFLHWKSWCYKIFMGSWGIGKQLLFSSEIYIGGKLSVDDVGELNFHHLTPNIIPQFRWFRWGNLLPVQVGEISKFWDLWV